MFGEKSKKVQLNTIAFAVFGTVIVLNIAIFFLWNNFQDNYVKYQQDQVMHIKEQVSEFISNGEGFSKDLDLLTNDYDFEILVVDDNVLYTSTGIEDIDVLERVYDEHYVYKELYNEHGYSVWICVNNIDFSGYVNIYLLLNVIITTIVIVIFMVFLYYFSKIIISSLVGVYKLILELKSSTSDEGVVETNSLVLDNINEELMLLISQVSLKYYDVKLTQNESTKIISHQKSLLEEQKQYLEVAIHDIKTPLSTVSYGIYNLNKNYNFETAAKEDVDYLYTQIQKAMGMVVESLENVRDDSLDIFVDEGEVVVNDIVEEMFTSSSILLKKRNVGYNISGDVCEIYTNKLKLMQLLNNITSNMIMYSADSTDMSIVFRETGVEFRNYFSNNNTNKFSTSRGKSFISNIATELNFEIVETKNEGEYIVDIEFGEHNILC